jgi:hypothetical protein
MHEASPPPSHAAHTSRGKWSQAGVPKRGWTCIGVEDLEEPSQLCDMCESIEIRYAHLMEHPDYRETLSVGCICAEHMEEDYVRPREREKKLKGAARRRKTWANRTWRRSVKGNSYINTDGFNITVFQNGKTWALGISNRDTGSTQKGKKSYPTEAAAKAAGFDALIWAKENL